jgi:hypothetical protein
MKKKLYKKLYHYIQNMEYGFDWQVPVNGNNTAITGGDE